MRLPTLSLRSRILVASVSLTLVTAVALSFVTRSAIDRSLSLGLNDEVGSALASALSVARAGYNDRRETLSRIGERIAGTPAAFAAFKAGDLPGLHDMVAALEGGGRVSDVRIVRFEPGTPIPDLGAPLPGSEALESLRKGPYLFRHEQERDLLRMIVPAVDGPRVDGVILLDLRLDPSYFTIERASQTYEDIGLSEEAVRRAHLHAFLTVAALVLLLSVLVGVWIAFGITHPLRDLIRGTEELAKDNLNHRIPPHREDEIGVLIASFNRMAADLQDNRVQRVEAEKVAAWREIARRLAHEIKNPLTPIQLTVQQMRDKYPGGDPGYRKLLDDCADIVTDEVETLKNLVKAFADFARLPDLKVSPTDLNALVSDVAKLYPETPLTLQLGEDLPPVSADETQLRRALINLIENAEDALSDGGRIAVTTRSHPRAEDSPPEPDGHAGTPGHSSAHGRDWVEVEIADTGRGIPSEHLGRVFEPYFSTKRTGMGLGLAIVRNIVEQHGGQIGVRSLPGEGAAFTIRLPAPTGHESRVAGLP